MAEGVYRDWGPIEPETHEFRMVFNGPEDGDCLNNFEIADISLDGQTLTSVAEITLKIAADGTPELRLYCIGDKYIEPLLKSIDIDTPVRLRMVTQERTDVLVDENGE